MSTIEKIKNGLPGGLLRRLWVMRLRLYTRIFVPIAARRIRHKPKINVLFALVDLGMWKTENLYCAMLKHPRFNPVLRVIPTPENQKAQQEVTDYLKSKQYNYLSLDINTPLQDGFNADIIFYQKPYPWSYSRNHTFTHNLNALFCFASYGIHNILSDFICNQPLHNIAWQYYYENSSCAQESAKYMDNRGRNIVVTGVPMFDSFSGSASEYHYGWKQQGNTKKRIIYAPHFSIETDSTLRYSTFLENGDFMLEMAHKYADKVQFVFKPHPLLQPHLYAFWGKEKTDSYYAAWDSLPNAKVELGQYTDLFMTSDAMVHDCSSFSIEYMFTRKPVMFLLHSSTDDHCSNLNTMSREAFGLHDKGVTHDDIEKFILRVIDGQDERRSLRDEFYEKYLKPINGRSSVENIIDAILNPEDWKALDK